MKTIGFLLKKISTFFNRKVFNNHRVSATFASKDFIVSSEEGERFLLQNDIDIERVKKIVKIYLIIGVCNIRIKFLSMNLKPNR